MKIKLWDIFWIFLKVGSVLLGGGYVILPILQAEIVEKRHWITQEELVDYYAVSQCLPGITAADVAMFVGYKLRGKTGVLVAGYGLIFVPFLIIVSLAAILSVIINFPIVKSTLWGVSLGVIILLITAIRDMWKQSIINKFTFILFMIVFLATAFFDFSPVITVLAAIISGIVYEMIRRRLVGEE